MFRSTLHDDFKIRTYTNQNIHAGRPGVCTDARTPQAGIQAHRHAHIVHIAHTIILFWPHYSLVQGHYYSNIFGLVKWLFINDSTSPLSATIRYREFQELKHKPPDIETYNIKTCFYRCFTWLTTSTIVLITTKYHSYANLVLHIYMNGSRLWDGFMSSIWGQGEWQEEVEKC